MDCLNFLFYIVVFFDDVFIRLSINLDIIVIVIVINCIVIYLVFYIVIDCFKLLFFWEVDNYFEKLYLFVIKIGERKKI